MKTALASFIKLLLCVGSLVYCQGAEKPNILDIMGDDVGYWNISAYHQGIMGYQTPNIDRLAREGGQFMSYYAQQSCTAGRSAFITGQFGKNHLGDKDEFLPTNHGFDEFFGNLYHLNGYDQTDYLTGKSDKSARNEFFYFSDDGDLLAVRVDRLKVHFLIQEATGIDVWRHPFTKLRAPIFFDLKVDPGERAQEGMGYDEWWYRRSFMAVPMQNNVGRKLMTFKDFPPTPSASVAGATLRDSKMQWRKEPSRLKADAPNILIVPIDGVSLAYTFENGQATSQKTTQYFENNGSRGIYHSGWYACAFGPFLPWDTPASVPRTVPGAFTASETLDVGTDLGAPVSLDYAKRTPFAFEGKIEKMEVSLPE
ncbi:MAG: sulfatase-like hydrolase/transferase [Planctomycetes bacterium]|nr:sulfatase-like hydrolase/transferase [Planctomycetota bacterium]